MVNSQLNLTRLWRSKRFEEIIGQPLVLRMLKNSLYKNIFFPVYLFAGSKGCGKTTTARIFAASINCEQLPLFQKNPKIVLPCHACGSCQAFFKGQHPDFIEIDGASHTSVDDVRSVIEASAFLPVLGRKKVYLIDEAHMLSKAAFNAFLKILEEPPHSALFILATTDAHKIIDTVLSRCFQLYFNPVSSVTIAEYLKLICEREALAYEMNALHSIAVHAEGSVRDALNIVERVRLASSRITEATVLEILGVVDNRQLVKLLEVIIKGDTYQLLILLTDLQLDKCNIVFAWKQFVELLTNALWIKVGHSYRGLDSSGDMLKTVLESVTIDQLISYKETCYKYELQFAKTIAPKELFQMLLLQLCRQNSEKTDLTSERVIKKKTVIAEKDSAQLVKQMSEWDDFLKELSVKEEPLIYSVFTQSRFVNFNSDTGSVKLAFARSLSFFKLWIDDSKKVWEPLINAVYKTSIKLEVEFIDEDIDKNQANFGNKIIKKDNFQNQLDQTNLIKTKIAPVTRPRSTNTKEEKIQLSAYGQAIAAIFPGTVTIVKEGEL